MKPWGSQHHFLPLLACVLSGNRERLAGGSRGAAMSPPVAAWRRRNLRHGCQRPLAHNRPVESRSVRFRVALDYSGFGTVVSVKVPPQQSGYAASLIRSDILGDIAVSLLDRPSCELTRLAPVSSPSWLSGRLLSA